MKMLVRLVVVLTAVTLTLAGMSVTASATEPEGRVGAGVKQASIALSDPGEVEAQQIAPQRGVKFAKYSVDQSWWGATYRFNASETSTIAASAAVCAGWVGKLPALGWVLAASCGSLSAYAGWLRSRDKCLMARVTRVGATVWWSWDC